MNVTPNCMGASGAPANGGPSPPGGRWYTGAPVPRHRQVPARTLLRVLLRVQRLDLVRVLLVDDPPLQLQRRRELLGVHGPFRGQDREALDLLGLAEVLVRVVDGP